jgi:hypothetical protein
MRYGKSMQCILREEAMHAKHRIEAYRSLLPRITGHEHSFFCRSQVCRCTPPETQTRRSVVVLLDAPELRFIKGWLLLRGLNKDSGLRSIPFTGADRLDLHRRGANVRLCEGNLSDDL